MIKQLSQIIRNTVFLDFIGSFSQEVTSVEYDSRKCKLGSCFVAISGNLFNGHDFISKAIEMGAKSIICEKYPPKEELLSEVSYILVGNSRKALGQVAEAFFDYPSSKLKIIGITGTNGKTTTSFIIKSIFEAADIPIGLIGTTGVFFNNEKFESSLTTPESSDLANIFNEMIKVGIETVVMEVSSIAIVMNRTDFINFDLVAFTNLTQDHLDLHNTMENYAQSKKLLFDKLDKNAIVVVNTDSNYYEFMIKNCKSEQIYLLGRSTKSTFKIIKEEYSNIGNNFIIYKNDVMIDARTKLTGSFNVENAAMAATICYLLGIDILHIQKGLSLTDGAPGRMQKIMLRNGAIALVDYAHTPDALEKCILSCLKINNQNKIICVFGCGGDRDKTKRPKMGKIASELSDYVIITNDNPRNENPQDIFDNIMEGIEHSAHVQIIEDRRKAIQYAVLMSNSNDIILVAGKGHENYQIIGNIKTHFDDVEVLNEFI